MPSDAKKRKDQKKKDAAKNRNKKGPKENGEAEEVNGVNGEVTANGINGHAGIIFIDKIIHFLNNLNVWIFKRY